LCRVITRGAGVAFAKEPTPPPVGFRLGPDLGAASGPTWWRVAVSMWAASRCRAGSAVSGPVKFLTIL
jgi:hypothetical protein